MSLLNTRDSEASRGEKKKRQDQNPGFPTSVLLVFCDNTEDHGSIPKTGERDKRDMTDGWKRTWWTWKRTQGFQKTWISTRLQPGVEAQPRVT